MSDGIKPQPPRDAGELEVVQEIFFKHRHICGKPGDICSCFDRQEADMAIREIVGFIQQQRTRWAGNSEMLGEV